ncbi:MAG: Gfo/Idh/MocA family oxidoreductase [Pirellulales bacterium]|nr:Gfo/Idh/MocA family oxidoreductase [Pirellulales bacterium]
MMRKTTRRGFVKSGALLAAAPYVIASNALGNEDIPPASERVALGHVGLGGRGRGLFNDAKAVGRAQSVAVADCYRDRREAAAAACKGKAYGDFRDILARDDIDAVIIATPDHWHVPICMMAAKAGKHVYVEKPLGLTINQDLKCRELVERRGTIFQYGTQQRSMTRCFRGCEYVRRGAIGKILAVEVDAPNGGSGGSTAEAPVPDGFDYDMWLGPAPEKPHTVDRCKPPGTYWIYDQSIGYLAGWGAHPLDIMVWGCDADLSGTISIEGTGVVPTEGLYDTVYDWNVKGKLGEVDFTFRPGPDRTKFIGENGWIEVSRALVRNRASDPMLLKTKPAPADDRLMRVAGGHMDNFIAAVANNDPKATVATVRDAARSDIISHLCDIAIRTGEKIAWDPIEHKITSGGEKARAMLSRPMRKPWEL